MTYDPTYSKRWHYDAAHGRLRTTPGDPVRAHVRQLLDAGWSQRSIADAAGVGASTVHHVLNDCDRVKVTTARALLAVTEADILARSNPLGFVRRVGAARRVQALLAIGWRHEDISAAMRDAGTGCRVWSHLVLSQRGAWINRATHDAVVHAYDKLSMRPGPSARTRARALKAGFVPPLALDDDMLDTPPCQPEPGTSEPAEFLDEVAIAEAMAGRRVRLTKAERSEAVRRLTGRGLSAREIGERLHTTGRTVQRWRAAA